MAVIIAVFAAMPVSNAATISGTVYKEDGSSPVSDATIAVNVYDGTPCGIHQVVAQDTTGNGSFVIAGLSPGTYYLKAEKYPARPTMSAIGGRLQAVSGTAGGLKPSL